MNNFTAKWPIWTIAMFFAGVAGGVGAMKYIPAFAVRFATPTTTANIEAAPQTKPAAAALTTSVETKIAAPDPEADRAAALELKRLRDEISAPNSAANAGADHTPAPHSDDPTVDPHAQTSAPASAAGEQTLAYWNGMNTIMEHEAAMRPRRRKLPPATRCRL